MRRIACRSSSCRNTSIKLRTSLARPCSMFSGLQSMRDCGSWALNFGSGTGCAASCISSLEIHKFGDWPRSADARAQCGGHCEHFHFLIELFYVLTFNQCETTQSVRYHTLAPVFYQRLGMLPQFRRELLQRAISFLAFSKIGCAGWVRRESGCVSQEGVHLHRGGETEQQIFVFVRTLVEMLTKFIFALENCWETEWNDWHF